MLEIYIYTKYRARKSWKSDTSWKLYCICSEGHFTLQINKIYSLTESDKTFKIPLHFLLYVDIYIYDLIACVIQITEINDFGYYLKCLFVYICPHYCGGIKENMGLTIFLYLSPSLIDDTFRAIIVEINWYIYIWYSISIILSLSIFRPMILQTLIYNCSDQPRTMAITCGVGGLASIFRI